MLALPSPVSGINVNFWISELFVPQRFIDSENSKVPSGIGVKFVLFLLESPLNAMFKCIFPEQCIFTPYRSGASCNNKKYHQNASKFFLKAIQSIFRYS